MFVIMYGNEFCKFGSYSSAKLVTNAVKANLYSTKGLADTRRNRCNSHGIYMGDVKYTSGFRTVELKITYKIITGTI
jgi:hypothetical protein